PVGCLAKEEEAMAIERGARIPATERIRSLVRERNLDVTARMPPGLVDELSALADCSKAHVYGVWTVLMRKAEGDTVLVNAPDAVTGRVPAESGVERIPPGKVARARAVIADCMDEPIERVGADLLLEEENPPRQPGAEPIVLA